jgi:hypothetical protein
MLGGIECSLWTFAVGATALSLEVFELPYIMMLLGIQMFALLNAKDSLAPVIQHGNTSVKVVGMRVTAAPPPPPRVDPQPVGPGWVGASRT